MDQPKKNCQKRPFTCQNTTFQRMNSSYCNYQTMPTQTKFARNWECIKRFYLKELLLLLSFNLGPILDFFCNNFRKKRVLDSFEYQKQKKYIKFFERHLKVENFPHFFVFWRKRTEVTCLVIFAPQVPDSGVHHVFLFGLSLLRPWWPKYIGLFPFKCVICVFSKFVAVTL